MKYVLSLILLLAPFGAYAGGSVHHNTTNITNNEPQGGAGGNANADADGGSAASNARSFFLALPSASVGATNSTAGCRVGYSRNYGGLYAYSDSRRDKRCMALQDIAIACHVEENGKKFDKDACDRIRNDLIAGKYNDDYEASAKSQEVSTAAE